jgi:hypothetical protein
MIGDSSRVAGFLLNETTGFHKENKESGKTRFNRRVEMGSQKKKYEKPQLVDFSSDIAKGGTGTCTSGKKAATCSGGSAASTPGGSDCTTGTGADGSCGVGNSFS